MASIRRLDEGKSSLIHRKRKGRKPTQKFFNDYTNSSDFGGCNMYRYEVRRRYFV